VTSSSSSSGPKEGVELSIFSLVVKMPNLCIADEVGILNH
jgi:hypothetical protein